MTNLTRDQLVAARALQFSKLGTDQEVTFGDKTTRAKLRRIDKLLHEMPAPQVDEPWVKLPAGSPGAGLYDDLRNADIGLANSIAPFVDEVSSGVGAAYDWATTDKSFGESYDRRMSEHDRKLQEFRTDNPYATPIEIATGITSGAALGNVAGPVGTGLKAGATSTVAAGATGGALSALAARPGSRGEAAVLGGAFSTALTGGVHGLAALKRLPVWATAARAWHTITGDLRKRVAKASSEIFKGARLDPADVRYAGTRAGARPTAVEFPELRHAAATGAEAGGPKAARELAGMQLYEEKLSEQLVPMLRKYGKNIPASAVRQAQAAARSAAAKVNYEAAYKKPTVMTEGLKEIWDYVKKEVMPDIVAEMRADRVANKGPKLRVRDILDMRKNPTTRAWDYVVKRLGYAINNKNTDGGLRARYIDIRNNLIEELYDGNDAYRYARDNFRGDVELQELVDVGSKMILNPKPSVIANNIRDIQQRHVRGFDPLNNPADQELIVTGILEGIEDRIAMGADAAETLSRPAIKKLLQTVLGDDVANDITKVVFDKLATGATTRMVQKGVDTGVAARTTQPLTGQTPTPQPPQFSRTERGMVVDTFRNLQRYGDDVADEIAGLLMTSDPKKRTRWIDDIISRRGKDADMMKALTEVLGVVDPRINRLPLASANVAGQMSE